MVIAAWVIFGFVAHTLMTWLAGFIGAVVAGGMKRSVDEGTVRSGVYSGILIYWVLGIVVTLVVLL